MSKHVPGRRDWLSLAGRFAERLVLAGLLTRPSNCIMLHSYTVMCCSEESGLLEASGNKGAGDGLGPQTTGRATPLEAGHCPPRNQSKYSQGQTGKEASLQFCVRDGGSLFDFTERESKK